MDLRRKVELRSASAYACIHVCMCRCLHTYIRASIRTTTCAFWRKLDYNVCMRAYTHIQTCMRMILQPAYIRTYIPSCTCIQHTYICMHPHTYIHTHLRTRAYIRAMGIPSHTYIQTTYSIHTYACIHKHTYIHTHTYFKSIFSRCCHLYIYAHICACHHSERHYTCKLFFGKYF